MSEQAELLPINHFPIRKAREGHIGEIVYTREWEILMNTNGYPENSSLELLLYQSVAPADQRAACVAASFICWLGTSCGKGFIRMAESFREHLRDSAYLAAWAIENRRHGAINGGYRCIEHLLAGDILFEQRHFGWGLSAMPELTLNDHEIVECVVIWLEANEGQAFIARCERMIDYYNQNKVLP